MNRAILNYLLVSLWLLALPLNISAQTGAYPGNEQAITVHSNILGEDRSILIQVPESYSVMESKEYPVIIVLDGRAFLNTTSSTVQFMSSRRNGNYLMDESIVVAIENVDRERDFTVTKIETVRKNTMGGGRKFLSFVQDELVPFVDSSYRTTGRTTLIGHSLGGLLAMNAFMDENTRFDAFIAIDPSIWWDQDLMNEKLEAVKPTAFARSLYIASANQGPERELKNKLRHQQLYEGLVERGGPSAHIKWQYFDDEGHRSVPLIAIYEGLKFVNSSPKN